MTPIETIPQITPGEWTAGVGKFKGEDMFLVGLLGTSKLIAVCGKTGAQDEPESIANAYLIAAAKEMLELLQESVDGISTGWNKRRDAALKKAAGIAST